MMINRGVGLYMLTLVYGKDTRVSANGCSIGGCYERDKENDVVAYFARDVSYAHTPDKFMREIL